MEQGRDQDEYWGALVNLLGTYLRMIKRKQVTADRNVGDLFYLLALTDPALRKPLAAMWGYKLVKPQAKELNEKIEKVYIPFVQAIAIAGHENDLLTELATKVGAIPKTISARKKQ